MNHETEVKQQDINAIHNLFYEYHYADDLGVIKSKLAEYVATVRREEREAAFERTCLAVCARCRLAEQFTPAERVGNGKRWFHRAANTSFEDGIASQCDAWPIRNLIIEASASEKGEMNG